VFDCASLTKVIATTACLMRLFEQGRFPAERQDHRLHPEFQDGKSDITIRNLMTHFSGLRPDVPLSPEWSGYATGIHLRASISSGLPGEKHVYSDIQFHPSRRVGSPPDRRDRGRVRAQAHLFAARDEGLDVPAAGVVIPRIAPTEKLEKTGEILRGVVHDPTARNMVASPATPGSFHRRRSRSLRADDADMGKLGNKRLFSALTVEKFTERKPPPISRSCAG